MKYLPDDFPSDDLREHLKATEAQGLILVVPESATKLWQYCCLTAEGARPIDLSDTGRDVFYGYFPWKEGNAPKPHDLGLVENVAQVLVGGSFCPKEGVPLTIKDLTTMSDNFIPLAERCQRHGIETAMFRSVDDIAHFWKQFFGTEKFLDADPVSWQVPHLILSSGDMKNYPLIGGEHVNVTDRLKLIGTEVGIPVEFV